MKKFILNNKSTFKGIILDNLNVVGTFRAFSAEDAFGKRDLFFTRIEKKAFNKKLKFLYVEMINNGKTYTTVDDFGFGTLEGTALIDGNYFLIDNAVFSKD